MISTHLDKNGGRYGTVCLGFVEFLWRPMMTIRKLYSAIIFSVLFLFLSFPICFSSELTLNNTPVQVYFSPFGGCTQAIVKEIGKAKNQILIQAYSFTSKPIAKALLDAHKRGVKVEAIVDKSLRTANYSSATFLANSRVPTFIDDAHDIAHNKILLMASQ
jgi:phosphatidylserine/phosphatidylglycerophosphate/cardiolipin synthase-like enzyme